MGSCPLELLHEGTKPYGAAEYIRHGVRDERQHDCLRDRLGLDKLHARHGEGENLYRLLGRRDSTAFRRGLHEG